MSPCVMAFAWPTSTWLPNDDGHKGNDKYPAILNDYAVLASNGIAIKTSLTTFRNSYYPFACYLLRTRLYAGSRWTPGDQVPPLVAGKLSIPRQRWRILVRSLNGSPSKLGVTAVSPPRGPPIPQTLHSVV